MFASGKTAAVASAANYIEDVFSTYLYTGDDSTSRLIQNNIDLSTKGGLVWLKCRSDAQNHALYDTARGATKRLISNLTNAQDTVSGVSAFNTNGFTMGADLNYLGQTMASWTFREQPKFFDVVTYTGNDVIGRQIPHNLGSVPGCIIVKQTNAAREWAVYHTSLGNTQYINLNSTGGAQTQTYWNNTSPTSTNFTVGDWGAVNGGGNTYVAYLFAHNAGGFGLTGTDNVISCGSFTSDGSSPISVNLGYEPQWVLVKASTASGYDWWLFDNMRGTPVGSGPQMLRANTSGAETTSSSSAFQPNATGFTADGSWLGASTFIYIAIRRGPMKVPTSGTSVFAPVTQTGNTLVTTNFPVDLVIDGVRNVASGSDVTDRLRGSSTNFYNFLYPNSTSAETTGSGGGYGLDNNNGYQISGVFGGTTQTVMWNFRRAPNFFDEVCYTGNYYVGTDFQALTHNLGVVPELAIIKRRSSIKAWNVYYGNVSQYMELQSTAAESAAGDRFDGRSPTATTFYVGADSDTNTGGQTYVMYLFATCAGVSKVGSYTGTGTTKQIDCGFAAGARFVLIKRTDSTGDWYVWDTARGIVSGNDPYLLLNSTAAETTGTDYIDTYSAGFEISSTAPAAINASGGTFLFLAIA